MKKNTLENIRPLVRDLIRRDSDPGEIHICPNCGGKLHVSIAVYQEPGQDKELSVGVYCDDCKIVGFFEYQKDHVPPWAKESKYKDMSIDVLWSLARGESGKE